MSSILMVGYGNVTRRDDGVAYYAIHRLRERLGLPARGLYDDGYDELGQSLAMLCVPQLSPEMSEVLSRYKTVVFMDAHIAGVGWGPIHWQPVTPREVPRAVGHTLSPGEVLAFCRVLYGQEPEAYSLSILGTDFSFGEELSAGTAGLVDQAVDQLVVWMRSQACGSAPG